MAQVHSATVKADCGSAELLANYFCQDRDAGAEAMTACFFFFKISLDSLNLR